MPRAVRFPKRFGHRISVGFIRQTWQYDFVGEYSSLTLAFGDLRMASISSLLAKEQSEIKLIQETCIAGIKNSQKTVLGEYDSLCVQFKIRLVREKFSGHSF